MIVSLPVYDSGNVNWITTFDVCTSSISHTYMLDSDALSGKFLLLCLHASFLLTVENHYKF